MNFIIAKKILKISYNYYEHIGQRIDNFLSYILKGVCKSHIYKLLRLGKIKVNKKRVKHNYKLLKNDILKLPLIKTIKKQKIFINNNFKLKILFEDNYILVVNKKFGIAVHSGSGINYGLIDIIRNIKKNIKFLELVHRLDKDTSGILLIAKKRSCLKYLHEQIRNKLVDKRYLVLVYGIWNNLNKHIKLPLGKKIINGKKYIYVKKNGKTSHTIISLVYQYKEYSLLEVKLKTGRTHQIRVHLSHIGLPVVGDTKYGNYFLNKYLNKKNYENLIFKRMFLHSYKINFIHPNSKKRITLISSLPTICKNFLKKLK